MEDAHVSTPVSRCRPPSSARTTRPACISFATATGRDDVVGLVSPRAHQSKPRPLTARPRSSQRRLTLSSSSQWHFLTKTPTKDVPATLVRPTLSHLRTRPATARFERTTSSSAVSLTRLVPKRPATCRGPRRQSSVNAPPAKQNLVLVDPRVLHEAARHETEQEVYTGPLAGKSVEVHPPDLLAAHKPFRDSGVVNAISLSEFHRGRAFQARAKGDQQRTIDHLEKLLAFVPNDHAALFQLAIAYEKTGRLEDAQRTYVRVMPMEPDSPFVHYNMGNLLMKMDLVEDAIAAYTTAIQKNGSDRCQSMVFYRQRGAAYRKRGEFEKAAKDYARVHAEHRKRCLTVKERNTSVPAPFPISHAADVVDSKYSAEPIYSATHFASLCTPLGQTMTSVDLLHHTQALAIAAKPFDKRTQDDLCFMGDELGRRFPCCEALDPEARKQLATRVVAGTNLPSGTVLMHEGTSGGRMIFFIARGRVSVYKRFAPRVAVSFNGNQETEKEAVERNKADCVPGVDAIVSWESLQAYGNVDPTGGNKKTDALWSTVELKAWSAGGGTGEQHQVLLTHLSTGAVCGRQGRFSLEERLYSVVVSEPCDFFAVSWGDFQEVERMHRLANSSQMARFFSTVPLFHRIPNDELLELCTRARNHKVVGERVICTEGQPVNGLVIVREGQLCKLYPSQLNRPPNFSVAFSLSGSITMNDRDAEHGGLHFFTQLEHSDDPLLCVHDSAMMHGFLPPDFLPHALARLSERHEDERGLESGRSSTAHPSRNATSLYRGAFFNASSSWIPPRQSRRDDNLPGASSGGVSCAKAALFAMKSCELIFFTATDLKLGLSVNSRTLLHNNMQQINARHAAAFVGRTPTSPVTSGGSVGGRNLRRHIFLKPPSDYDLVQKRLHDIEWQNYKQTLVNTVVTDAREKRPRSFAAHAHLVHGKRPPVTERLDWKR